jgi:transitional endoplasmic reticulum ATPase
MSATAKTRLTSTQQKCLDTLLVLARKKATPLLELRSPPYLGRGHGVTTILRSTAESLGVPLLGISTVLAGTHGAAGNEPRILYANVVESLKVKGIAVVDDLDLAAAPRSLRRSRTLVGETRGAGDLFNWEVPTAPAMVMKALSDEAAALGAVLIFSVVEDSHFALSRKPLSISLGEPNVEDYLCLLQTLFSPSSSLADAEAVFSLHSQLGPADLAAAVARVSASTTDSQASPCSVALLLTAIREDLVATSAVAPEEVEPVDLAAFPGLESIKEELERNVLLPLEQPALASKLGLTPKRGVLLHGQPGTGKTTVGRWLAHRLKGKFFLVREMMVQADIIKVFAAAEAASPSIVFIDDADIVIGGWRPLDGHRGSDIFRFLLGRMDGLTSRGKRQRENGEVVVMLTGQNVHWMAEMLLRSGRIELWLKTKLSEPRHKREILKKYISEDAGAMELLCKDGQLPDVTAASQASDNFCCADLRRVVSDAKVLAAWDQLQGTKMLDGKGYLEKAAEGVRRMQEEVRSTSRSLYG